MCLQVFVVYVMFTCVCVRAFVGGWVSVSVSVSVPVFIVTNLRDAAI